MADTTLVSLIDELKLIEATEEQRKALTSEKLLTVVSAGAGTGKTKTLAQRYAWLLASDKECKAEDILVLTFTKKAAREMRERIEKTLKDWYTKSGGANGPLGHLKERISALDGCCISTIHSFAMRLIKESGLTADIDPSAAVIPDPKRELWWKTFETMLAQYTEEKFISFLSSEKWRDRAEGFVKSGYMEELISEYGASVLTKNVEECTEKLCCAGQSTEDLWNKDLTEAEKEVANKEDKILTEICSAWLNPEDGILPQLDRNGLLDAKAQTAQNCRELHNYWRTLPNNIADRREFWNELRNGVLCRPSGKVKTAIEEILEVKLTDWRKEYIAKLECTGEICDEEKEACKILCQFCALGWEAWDEFRRKENLLTLSDLIGCAVKVLKSTVDSSPKFKHIMVDEFQDTDPLQDELIKCLWPHPRVITDSAVTLFIVGDIKQSIYRFRHAEPDLFRDYIAEAMDSKNVDYAQYVSLNINFRTTDKLLWIFNETFEKLWFNNPKMRYERLNVPDNAQKRNAQAAKPPMVRICALSEPQEEDKKVRSEELRRILYIGLAEKLFKMHEKGTPVWDKQIGEFRPVQWHDMTVLMPSRIGYAHAERAFNALGIPYILVASKNYFSRGEIADVVNLISLLADPEDPLRLSAWLASPLSGITQEECTQLLIEAGNRRQHGENLPINEVFRAKFPQKAYQLDTLRARAQLSGVASAILELLSDPTVLKNYDGATRRRVYTNIMHLKDMAEEYDMSEGPSLKGCADYLSYAAESDKRSEEPDASGDDADAVRIMTIHASKGLEFPIVALLYEPKRKPAIGAIRVSKKYGVIPVSLPSFMDFEEDGGACKFAKMEDEEEKAAERAERERLFYVGFTRAQDMLILCRTHKQTAAEVKSDTKDNKEASGKDFLENIPTEVEYENNNSIKIKEIIIRPEDVRNFENFWHEHENKSSGESNILKPSDAKAKLRYISSTAYSMISYCPAAYRTIYRQGCELKWTGNGRGSGGPKFGSFIHWILERWDFQSASLEEFLPRINNSELYKKVLYRIPFELRTEYANEKKRKGIRDLLCDYAKTDEAKQFVQLAKNGILRREMHFRVPILDGSLILTGSIDLFWKDGDSVHIRDWKSALEEKSPSVYYKKQLDFYAYALYIYNVSKNSKGKVPAIDAADIYLRPFSAADRTLKVYSEKDFNEIAKTIEKAAANALYGGFKPAVEKCGLCPWKGKCTAKLKTA